MTEPLTDQRFSEIQALEPADHTPQEIGTAILDLVREIDRQRHSLKRGERSHLATLAGACMALGLPKGTAEPDVFEAARRLRAELEQARAAALTEGATELDRIADQAEAEVAARYPGLTGYGSCDMVREAARTLRDMAAAPARA